MTEGRRARADQVAKRVNTAVELLDGGMEVADVAVALARRHRLSERQACRYVEPARDEGPMEVARPKVVFTVKLPAVLARRVRQRGEQSGRTISALVAQALTEFLARHGPWRATGGHDRVRLRPHAAHGVVGGLPHPGTRTAGPYRAREQRT